MRKIVSKLGCFLKAGKSEPISGASDSVGAAVEDMRVYHRGLYVAMA